MSPKVNGHGSVPIRNGSTVLRTVIPCCWINPNNLLIKVNFIVL